MKGFVLALLALPAILAAPAQLDQYDPWPTTFPIKTYACDCTDGGSRFTVSSCLYFGSPMQGERWCYPTTNYSPHMEQTFTADFCKLNDPTMPIPECKPIQICKGAPLDTSSYYEFVLC